MTYPAGIDGQSYEKGYRDGENNAHTDWWIALIEIMPDGVELTPEGIANYITRLQGEGGVPAMT